MKKSIEIPLLICAMVALPAIANAGEGVTWPGLTLEYYTFKWGVVLLAACLQVPFFRLASGLDWKKSARFTLLANLPSALSGIVVIPVAGLLWELVMHQVFGRPGIETFTIGWLFTAAFAVAHNVFIERTVLAAAKVSLEKPIRRLAVANVLSVGLACLMTFLANYLPL